MIEQRSEAWLEQRKGLITASNVGAILGLDPYRTPDDVMRQMVRDWHGAEREFTGNAATEWGVFNEKTAREQFEMMYEPVTECGFFVRKAFPWLGASPDGLVGSNGLIEIKCPYGLRNELNPVFKTIEEQPHYYAQMQIQMLVTYRYYCHFYQWSPNGDAHKLVQFDIDWITENLPKLKAFYDRYLIERRHSNRHIQPKKREIDTLEARKLIDEYQQLADAISLATDRKKEVLASIVSLAKEQDSLVCGHNLTKVQKEGSISYAKAIKELLPDADLEKWRGKPTEYWVLK